MFTESRVRSLFGESSAPLLIPAGIACMVEGVAAIGFGVVAAFQIHPERAVVTVGTTVVMILYGVGLLLAGRGLWRHRGWARGYAVCAQLLHLPIAWSFLQGMQGGTFVFGLALALVSVGIGICVFWPSSIRAFADPNGPPGQH